MNEQDTATPEARGRPGRKPSGQVIARATKNGPPSFSIRFTAYGDRHQLALGPQVTTRPQAEEELANVLADVRRGTWRPRQPLEVPIGVPTFHEFASSWFERHRHEVRDRTRQYWLELLTPHLLPFFADYPLDCITPEVVDSYKSAKLRERERWDSATPDERKLLPQGLGAGRINRSLALHARILEEAVEYKHIGSNAAAGRKRKVQQVPKPSRTWLELHEVQAVLDAAGEHRALIATMMLGGLRVGELIQLRWRDVDLAGGALHVAGAKTDAGVRVVEDVSPMLREALTLHRADTKYSEPGDRVFCTARGTPTFAATSGVAWSEARSSAPTLHS